MIKGKGSITKDFGMRKIRLRASMVKEQKTIIRKALTYFRNPSAKLRINLVKASLARRGLLTKEGVALVKDAYLQDINNSKRSNLVIFLTGAFVAIAMLFLEIFFSGFKIGAVFSYEGLIIASMILFVVGFWSWIIYDLNERGSSRELYDLLLQTEMQLCRTK